MRLHDQLHASKKILYGDKYALMPTEKHKHAQACLGVGIVAAKKHETFLGAHVDYFQKRFVRLK